MALTRAGHGTRPDSLTKRAAVAWPDLSHGDELVTDPLIASDGQANDPSRWLDMDLRSGLLALRRFAGLWLAMWFGFENDA
jgi:hypothetical protein